MTEAIDVEVVGTDIVPAQSSSLIALAAPLEQIVEAQRAYHESCIALLDDNDLQVIGPKTFKKRSAWNKLAVAFAVSTSEVRTTHERDDRGRIIRTECVVRATAPNGRVSDGLGACDRYERCCDPAVCTKLEFWEDSGRSTGHKHCTFPCHQAHFSNPQHDIPATAFTRASNRAKADLFGMGEVSAEEVAGDGSGAAEATPRQAAAAPATSRPSGSSAGSVVSDGQLRYLARLTNTTVEAAQATYGQLSASDASKLIDELKA
jgi:hypothetical protein